MEARVGLVPASVFKTDEALREQRLGGFDSHAFPPLYTTVTPTSAVPRSPRNHLGTDDHQTARVDATTVDSSHAVAGWSK